MRGARPGAPTILGVDLASDPARTAACLLRARARGGPELVACAQPCGDRELDALAAQADLVAIDAPLGWPAPFVELVAAPAGPAPAPWSPAGRDALRYRTTDLVAARIVGRPPLSVSTDLIGVVALRAALCLARWGVQDRSGAGRVCEVWPAGSLRRWGLVDRGYKPAGRHALRRALVGALSARSAWRVAAPTRDRLIASADALDAAIAALSGLCQRAGLVEPIPAGAGALARREGWIALPKPDALERLARGWPA